MGCSSFTVSTAVRHVTRKNLLSKLRQDLSRSHGVVYFAFQRSMKKMKLYG